MADHYHSPQVVFGLKPEFGDDFQGAYTKALTIADDRNLWPEKPCEICAKSDHLFCVVAKLKKFRPDR